MTTKATGAELKAFYADPSFWQDDAYCEDNVIIVDGKVLSDDSGIQDIPDAASVSMSGGIVFDLPGVDPKDSPTFEGHFNQWRKLQTTARGAFECPKDKLDAVIAAIIAAGGKNA